MIKFDRFDSENNRMVPIFLCDRCGAMIHSYKEGIVINKEGDLYFCHKSCDTKETPWMFLDLFVLCLKNNLKITDKVWKDNKKFYTI